MKKRILSLALAVCLCAGLSAPAMAAGPTFSDVPASHWAYSYVEKAADNGWVTGIGNGLFGVDQQVTYAELSTMLVRAFYPELPEHYGGAITRPNDYEWWEPYYYGIANFGLDRGTQMYSQDVHSQPVNRYEMAQLLSNIVNLEEVKLDYNAASVQAGIGDWSSVPSNYRDALTTVVAAGIITGVDSNGTFNGNGYMTRGQAAVVMCRMAEVMETGAVTTPTEPTESTKPTTPTDPSDPFAPAGGYGQKLSSGATAAAGVKTTISKNDAYPTYGNSDVVSNNGYFTGATNADIGTAQLQYAFLDLVNEARVAEGHAPLSWVGTDSAEEHSLQRCWELVSNFSHERGKGKFAGEVIARGQASAQEAFDDWMNSPGHKQTLMSDSDTYMAAARAGSCWIICVWNDSGIQMAEKWASENYDRSSIVDD